VSEELIPPVVGSKGKSDRLRILSLTGGGYRGFFTATVLALLEKHIAPRKLVDCFDVFAGTSIGGLLAAGLAAGITAGSLQSTIKARAPLIFPAKRFTRIRRAVGTVYEAGPVGDAIDACLGGSATLPVKSVGKGLIITAASWVSGGPVLYRSASLGALLASNETLRDACLATSAAPTYFPAHVVDGAPMLDGGLAANNPDAVALLDVLRRWPHALPSVEMLSVGTAGVGSGGMAGEVHSSGLGWMLPLISFMFATQERLAAEQVGLLLGKRYLRINHSPQPGQRALAEMDVVDSSMTGTLEALANAAVGDVLKNQLPQLNAMLS
jgi:hypothetical protein